MRKLTLLMLVSTLSFVACKKKDVVEQQTEDITKEPVEVSKPSINRSKKIKFPSKPLDLKFDVTKIDEQLVALSKNKKISDEDIRIIHAIVIYNMHILSNEVLLDGKTYREILDETKKDKKAMEWINMQEEEYYGRKVIDSWKNLRNFHIYEKWVDKGSGMFSSDSVYLSYELKNISDKDIKYLRGTLRLFDVSNEPYHDVEIEIKYTNIKAGSSYKEDLRIVDNYSWVARLKKTEFEDLRYRFWVDVIEYTDGTGFPMDMKTGEVIK